MTMFRRLYEKYFIYYFKCSCGDFLKVRSFSKSKNGLVVKHFNINSGSKMFVSETWGQFYKDHFDRTTKEEFEIHEVLYG